MTRKRGEVRRLARRLLQSTAPRNRQRAASAALSVDRVHPSVKRRWIAQQGRAGAQHAQWISDEARRRLARWFFFQASASALNRTTRPVVGSTYLLERFFLPFAFPARKETRLSGISRECKRGSVLLILSLACFFWHQRCLRAAI